MVLIEAMEQYSGLEANTFQIARLKESLGDMTDRNRTAKNRKPLAEPQAKKN